MTELNKKQKEAVSSTKGPLLVVAGAGAGKTKTVTERILALIEQGVAPKSILAITFTNKAAKEISDRVDHLLKIKINQEEARPFIGTFHSLGVKIIKENHRVLGVPKHFAIFDREDSKKAVKEAMKQSGVDPKQYSPGAFLQIISRQKGELKTLKNLEEELENQIQADYSHQIAFKIRKKYDHLLEKEGALDFDDLLLKCVFLLRNKEILDHYQNLWHYIHIDEYQDTNRAQYVIANLLAKKKRNICVVGDGDQCIYSWRGAQFRNILDFEKDYPDAKIILLEENYRSTKNILDAANKVIEKNQLRIKKGLNTKKLAGEKLALIESLDENQEAKKISEEIEELIKKGTMAKDIAVLYRANFQSRALEESFMSHGIPYQVLGTKFFERKEIKDIISFIRASLNPKSVSDFKRIINVPPRGIGKITFLKILEGKEGDLNRGTELKVKKFRSLLEKIKKEAEKSPPSLLIKFILKETGLKDSLEKGGVDEKERLENILELSNLAERYGAHNPEQALENFLSDISLATDQDSMDKKENTVKLMTVHASKGLEFDYVFIAGLEEDLFPYQRAEMGEEEKEEERRLFYVALTRARKKVFLSYAGSRGIFGTRLYNNPSSFIFDIPSELMEASESKERIIDIEF